MLQSCEFDASARVNASLPKRCLLCGTVHRLVAARLIRIWDECPANVLTAILKDFSRRRVWKRPFNINDELNLIWLCESHDRVFLRSFTLIRDPLARRESIDEGWTSQWIIEADGESCKREDVEDVELDDSDDAGDCEDVRGERRHRGSEQQERRRAGSRRLAAALGAASLLKLYDDLEMEQPVKPDDSDDADAEDIKLWSLDPAFDGLVTRANERNADLRLGFLSRRALHFCMNSLALRPSSTEARGVWFSVSPLTVRESLLGSDNGTDDLADDADEDAASASDVDLADAHVVVRVEQTANAIYCGRHYGSVDNDDESMILKAGPGTGSSAPTPCAPG
mmetsp:Transcript_2330/g.7887  ORF Transcript_2330/g.7887 Transcript_2330/m.7887 type:complete len:339 (-) Transcript_2330:84-1100(-)